MCIISQIYSPSIIAVCNEPPKYVHECQAMNSTPDSIPMQRYPDPTRNDNASQNAPLLYKFYKSSLILFLSLFVQRIICRASFGWLSIGQYGHLKRPPLLSLCRDSLATTCPQGIIIGGLPSVVCSLLTGQTKIA